MAGNAKGEYRGLAYRNDAELQAWLARRPKEVALEAELPIIDPHQSGSLQQSVSANPFRRRLPNSPR